MKGGLQHRYCVVVTLEDRLRLLQQTAPIVSFSSLLGNNLHSGAVREQERDSFATGTVDPVSHLLRRFH